MFDSTGLWPFAADLHRNVIDVLDPFVNYVNNHGLVCGRTVLEKLRLDDAVRQQLRRCTDSTITEQKSSDLALAISVLIHCKMHGSMESDTLARIAKSCCSVKLDHNKHQQGNTGMWSSISPASESWPAAADSHSVKVGRHARRRRRKRPRKPSSTAVDKAARTKSCTNINLDLSAASIENESRTPALIDDATRKSLDATAATFVSSQLDANAREFTPSRLSVAAKTFVPSFKRLNPHAPPYLPSRVPAKQHLEDVEGGKPPTELVLRTVTEENVQGFGGPVPQTRLAPFTVEGPPRGAQVNLNSKPTLVRRCYWDARYFVRPAQRRRRKKGTLLPVEEKPGDWLDAATATPKIVPSVPYSEKTTPPRKAMRKTEAKALPVKAATLRLDAEKATARNVQSVTCSEKTTTPPVKARRNTEATVLPAKAAIVRLDTKEARPTNLHSATCSEKTTAPPVKAMRKTEATAFPATAATLPRKSCVAESAPSSGQPTTPSVRNYYSLLSDDPGDDATPALEKDAPLPKMSLGARPTAPMAGRKKPAPARSPRYSGYAWERPLSRTEEAEYLDGACPDFVPIVPASKSQRRTLRRRRVETKRKLSVAAKDFLPSRADILDIPKMTDVDGSPIAALEKLAHDHHPTPAQAVSLREEPRTKGVLQPNESPAAALVKMANEKPPKSSKSVSLRAEPRPPRMLQPSPSVQLDHGPSLTMEPNDAKPSRQAPSKPVPQTTEDSSLPPLMTYVEADTKRLHEVGWAKLARETRGRSDISDLRNVNHPAKRILGDYRDRGVPIKLKTEPWTKEKIDRALQRGAHQSCLGYLDYLSEEFADMRSKGQWIVLRAQDAKKLPGLRIAPPGVVPQVGRRARTIIDYTFNEVNWETLPIVPKEAMQFGHALERILREILLADPSLGPVEMIKVDLSDGFYRVDLNIDDIPKLGIVLPVKDGEEPLVAFPLVLPMGWQNSPPAFSAVTETITDLANDRLVNNIPAAPHPLDEAAELIEPPNPLKDDGPAPQATVSDKAQRPTTLPTPATDDQVPVEVKEGLERLATAYPAATAVPSARDPSLPSTGRPLAYVDIFVDDFIGLAQETRNRRRVRRILLHAIDDVIRPNDANDNRFRREPVSLKKLRQGDCSWSTVKLVLGWIIDTVSMTIHLPPRRVERLSEILSSIPIDQKRTSVKKWHKVLGELRSMSLALPGARHLFSHMQLALANKIKGRVSLTKGVHDSLEDFRWLLRDIASRPTRIAELVPLLASALGHHDASGLGAGGVWFPAETLPARDGYTNAPLVWRLKWPQDIIDKLVTSSKPSGTITNSDLELAGGLLHLEALAQAFDVRERTALSKTDNLNTLFWQRKASATTDRVPAHLLRMFGIHQRYHRYVPRHDYLSGPSNLISDALSRDFHLCWEEQLQQLRDLLPGGCQSCQIWEPSETFVESVLLALAGKRPRPESFLIEPSRVSVQCQQSVPQANVLEWASNPLVKGSAAKLGSYTKSADEFILDHLRPENIPTSLDKLKVTYGAVRRRPSHWGPRSN